MSTLNPRVLIVTPEVTYLPNRMGSFANFLTAKAGGLADVSAALINALFDQGADVHIALPNYRAIFREKLAPFLNRELNAIKRKMPHDRIHLAEDRAFFYVDHIYSKDGLENTKVALAFQREVINNIIPTVQPDLIHCNDWMTGLIPAMARKLGIPCLFTIHNIHTVKSQMSIIEERGLDVEACWENLYFEKMPINYQESRETNNIDFLTSGIFSSHFVNTVSPTFLIEIVEGKHSFVEDSIRSELINKWRSGCATGILNAPDPLFNPEQDKHLAWNYNSEDFYVGKQYNKRFLQESFGLIKDESAPLFFWPSRLDNIQKGCQLLSEILYRVVSSYWHQNLQIIFVADGEYKKYFKEIVNHHNLNDRVALIDFRERFEHIAYAASDFILMPSRFEPCGLPQMIAPIYGNLPVVHDTGGIHDTITHIDIEKNTGNGFVFKNFDSNGLFWAINEAMRFYNLPPEIKEPQIKRIMEESAARFNHSVTAKQYIELYERMLKCPLIKK
ncbi:MAG: glycogen/starch synthase [Desulfobacterales bacterium]|nr:glycogen/starch synthase [Desulfobacterales bacterium]